MTPTGPVAPERRHCILALMEEAFARQFGDSDLAIDRLALLRRDKPQASVC